MMVKIIKKNLNTAPDEVRTFEKGKIDIANLGDITIGRAVVRTGVELGEVCQANRKNGKLSKALTHSILYLVE